MKDYSIRGDKQALMLYNHVASFKVELQQNNAKVFNGVSVFLLVKT